MFPSHPAPQGIVRRRAQAPHTGREDAGTPLLPPLISLFGGSCPWQAPAPNPVWNLKPPKSLLGLAAASSIPLEVLCQRGGSRAVPPAVGVGKPHLRVSENLQTVSRMGLGTPRLPPALGEPFIALFISQRGLCWWGGLPVPPALAQPPGPAQVALRHLPPGQRCRLSLPPAPHWAPGN